MKTVLKFLWVTVCVIVLAAYFISCLTPFISPKAISFISLFALGFPVAFAAAFVCACTLFFINKKTAAILVIVMFVAGFKNISNTVAVNAPSWHMAKKPGSLRIMTWNVESFVCDFNQSRPEAKPRIAMLNAIHLYNPDIICFQEYSDTRNPHPRLYVSAGKELDSLGYKFSFISNDSVITRWLPTVIYRGVAVYAKHAFTDSGRVNLANKGLYENLVYTDIVYNNKPIRIFTAHLKSFGFYGDTTANDNDVYEATLERKHAVEHKLRDVELQHASEVATIRKYINASPYPVIYCGDINSTPASYTYNYLRGNLQDAFLQKGSGFGCTFYKLPKTLRIDVCLPDKSLKVLQCQVPQLYLSDHFPVVADVEWR